jgi:hypothetical protein
VREAEKPQRRDLREEKMLEEIMIFLSGVCLQRGGLLYILG